MIVRIQFIDGLTSIYGAPDDGFEPVTVEYVGAFLKLTVRSPDKKLRIFAWPAHRVHWVTQDLSGK